MWQKKTQYVSTVGKWEREGAYASCPYHRTAKARGAGGKGGGVVFQGSLKFWLSYHPTRCKERWNIRAILYLLANSKSFLTIFYTFFSFSRIYTPFLFLGFRVAGRKCSVCPLHAVWPLPQGISMISSMTSQRFLAASASIRDWTLLGTKEFTF